MQRKRVGLLINQVVSDYIAELMHGALRAAEDSQSDIYIFSNALMVNDREDESEAYAIRYNRNVVYSYSTRMGLDAVVIAYDGIKQCNKPGISNACWAKSSKNRALSWRPNCRDSAA